MISLRRTIIAGLLIPVVFCLLSANGQQTNAPSDSSTILTQIITDEIVKEAPALTTLDRAVLWTRLGESWWKDDPERARTWLKKAVQELEIASTDQENDSDRQRRLAIARSLLSIISPRDKALSDRLTVIFKPDAEHVSSDDGSRNASALIDTALSVLNTDPQRAIELGSESLRAGRTPRIGSLLGALRRRVGNSSDGLFLKTLAVARASYDRQVLATLAVVAFKGAAPSDDLRRRLLKVFAEGLLRTLTSPTDEATACNLASNAAPLLNEFARLLPQQAGLVRLAITRCQPSLQDWERQEVAESLSDQPLNTVDALLDAASKASDSKMRDSYLERAAYMAAQQKSFDRAISILDDISSEGQEQMSGTWGSWRWEYASSAAFARYKRADRFGMYQVITATPEKLRPFVQISVARELVKLGDRLTAIGLIDEARKGLAKADASDAADGYFSLVGLYAQLLPTVTPAVFNETVAAMNRVKQSSSSSSIFPKVGGESLILSNDILLKSFSLPISLLETDDVGVRHAISLIDSPFQRVALRLNLLNFLLERRRAAHPLEEPVVSKGKQNGNQ
jgi:tetratricopeptide (TPR) repeat protein